MKTIHKFISLFLLAFFIFAPQYQVLWIESSFPYTQQGRDTSQSDTRVMVKEQVASNNSLLRDLIDAFTPDGRDYQDSAIDYAKYILNYLLWIVSFLALIVIMYGFFQMFMFWPNQKSYDTALSYVKVAALALAIMRLAYFIVSFFFEVYNRVS